MEKRRILLIAGSIVLVSVLAVILVYWAFGSHTNARDNASASAKEEMMTTAWEWGRLAPLPESAKEFDISAEGNMFSRAFRASFYLDEDDLTKWLEASPGLRDAEEEQMNNERKEYRIKPGGGANMAQALIDFEAGFVEIYVSWS